jgi:hypothetical protein
MGQRGAYRRLDGLVVVPSRVVVVRGVMMVVVVAVVAPVQVVVEKELLLLLFIAVIHLMLHYLNMWKMVMYAPRWIILVGYPRDHHPMNHTMG